MELAHRAGEAIEHAATFHCRLQPNDLESDGRPTVLHRFTVADHGIQNKRRATGMWRENASMAHTDLDISSVGDPDPQSAG